MALLKTNFIPNPVFASLLGLCPLVAAADSFAAGCIIGIGTAIGSLLIGAFASLAFDFIPERLRNPLTVLFAAFFALFFGLIIDGYTPVLAEKLGIYIPLIAVNCLVLQVTRKKLNREEESHKASSFRTSLSYLGAALLISGIRELLGLGSLTLPSPGMEPLRFVLLPVSPLHLLATPAGGFILIGLLAALYRGGLRALGRRIP